MEALALLFRLGQVKRGTGDDVIHMPRHSMAQSISSMILPRHARQPKRFKMGLEVGGRATKQAQGAIGFGIPLQHDSQSTIQQASNAEVGVMLATVLAVSPVLLTIALLFSPVALALSHCLSILGVGHTAFAVLFDPSLTCWVVTIASVFAISTVGAQPAFSFLVWSKRLYGFALAAFAATLATINDQYGLHMGYYTPYKVMRFR